MSAPRALPFASAAVLAAAMTLAMSVAPSSSASDAGAGTDEAMPALRGTGDLGVVVERALGQVAIVDHSRDRRLATVGGLGDLSHASVVYSRDARYAYVFGRDGGLSKVDLLRGTLDARIVQAGNSIGGAISQDGSLVAVANYEPGGVRVFDAGTLEPVAEIAATALDDGRSRVVGLVDAPDDRFVFSLFDTDEIWVLDMSRPGTPAVERFADVGRAPYDALITPDGRHYIAGLFGEGGLAVLDLWHPERGVRKVLRDQAPHDPRRPVYKMPHLEGWAIAGDRAYLPAVGAHRVLVVDLDDWSLIDAIDVAGQPVFVMARPDGRHLWVNFALPDNRFLQVIDTESGEILRTLEPGAGVLHMEFSARGEELWASVRDENRVDVFDTRSFERKTALAADSPSGIFFSHRAHRTGL